MKFNVEFEGPVFGLLALTCATYACIAGFRKLIVEASKLENAEESTEEKPA